MCWTIRCVLQILISDLRVQINLTSYLLIQRTLSDEIQNSMLAIQTSGPKIRREKQEMCQTQGNR